MWQYSFNAHIFFYYFILNCFACVRRVYIAYLDSVNFFQPRQLRTTVYHELLIGYMDYVKTLGSVYSFNLIVNYKILRQYTYILPVIVDSVKKKRFHFILFIVYHVA